MLASAAGALALASAAAAEPWEGGRGVVTPFEDQVAAIAGEIAERPVRVYCNAEEEWSALAAATGFQPRIVWGYVTFTRGPSGWIPGDEAELSEPACRHGDAFWRGGASAKPARTCTSGTRTVQRTVHRVKKGKRVAVRVRVTVPAVKLCRGYVEGPLFALQTIAHESVHLSGVEDEAVAECYGMQLLAFVAWKLGAPDALARQMALDYWRAYYLVERPGTPYFDEGCRDGGVLDLAPDRAGWPSPDPVELASTS